MLPLRAVRYVVTGVNKGKFSSLRGSERHLTASNKNYMSVKTIYFQQAFSLNVFTE